MKKVLISHDLNSLVNGLDCFLNRSGVRLFNAGSNDELLNLHRTHVADLVITSFDLPGPDIEHVAASLHDAGSQPVPLLMVCDNTKSAIEQCSRCKPSAVIPRPVNVSVMTARAQKLLNIAWREACRVQVNAEVEGFSENAKFFCQSHDISVSGMLIEAEKVLAKGSRIFCSFVLPESSRVKVNAEIVRVVEQRTGAGLNQYGIMFLDLEPEERSAVEAFVNGWSSALS